MRRPRRAALLASGNAAADPLLRLLSAAGVLGPVGSTSFRVASRIANLLRGGEPVRTVDDFEPCRLVLIHASGEALAAAVVRLESARFDWGSRTILIIGGEDEAPVASLAARGACVGVIAPMPGFEERRFVLEGERGAAREIRPLIVRSGARLTVIPARAGLLFDAALTLSGSGVFALLAAADAAMGRTGVPRTIGDRVLEKSVERAVRSWMNARSQGWGGYPGAVEEQRVERQAAVLQCADPRTATFLRRVAQASREFMMTVRSG